MQSLWDAVAVPYLTCWFTWTEKYVYACNIWNVDKCRRYLQVSDTLWLPPVLPKHQGVHEVPLRVVCDVWHQEVDVGFGSCGGASLTEVVQARPECSAGFTCGRFKIWIRAFGHFVKFFEWLLSGMTLTLDTLDLQQWHQCRCYPDM